MGKFAEKSERDLKDVGVFVKKAQGECITLARYFGESVEKVPEIFKVLQTFIRLLRDSETRLQKRAKIEGKTWEGKERVALVGQLTLTAFGIGRVQAIRADDDVYRVRLMSRNMFLREGSLAAARGWGVTFLREEQVVSVGRDVMCQYGKGRVKEIFPERDIIRVYFRWGTAYMHPATLQLLPEDPAIIKAREDAQRAKVEAEAAAVVKAAKEKVEKAAKKKERDAKMKIKREEEERKRKERLARSDDPSYEWKVPSPTQTARKIFNEREAAGESGVIHSPSAAASAATAAAKGAVVVGADGSGATLHHRRASSGADDAAAIIANKSGSGSSVFTGTGHNVQVGTTRSTGGMQWGVALAGSDRAPLSGGGGGGGGSAGGSAAAPPPPPQDVDSDDYSEGEEDVMVDSDEATEEEEAVDSDDYSDGVESDEDYGASNAGGANSDFWANILSADASGYVETAGARLTA
jgi:hypothetical protein